MIIAIKLKKETIDFGEGTFSSILPSVVMGSLPKNLTNFHCPPWNTVYSAIGNYRNAMIFLLEYATYDSQTDQLLDPSHPVKRGYQNEDWQELVSPCGTEALFIYQNNKEA